MSSWTEIGEIIILVSSILMAITTIWNFLRDKGLFISKKWKKGQKEYTLEVMKEAMPDILLQHDLETRKKYLEDRERYLNEIKGSVVSEIGEQLNTIDELQVHMEALAESAKDVLREKIMALYHKNKATRALEEHEKEALTQYYKDYKAIGGNSYIDKYYARMITWIVTPDDYIDD